MHAVTRALTAALVVLVALAQLPVGTIQVGTVECCCGEHAADETCGCPDCPAARDRDHDGQDQDRDPIITFMLTACSGELSGLAPSRGLLALRSPTARPPDGGGLWQECADTDSIPPSHIIEIVSPPG